MRAAPLFTRLGLSLAALGAALIAAELAVERWFPVGGAVYRLDAELLHDARPDAARIQPMPRARVGPGDAARVLVTTGPEGMRGRGLDRSGQRPRVLVIGDSLVMAENVPIDSTFVRQLTRALEEELDLPAWSLEGVNAGRSDYGPDQSLLLLERCAREIQPSLVVFVLCAHNDLGDLARNRLFALEGEELVRRSPGVAPRIEVWFREVERAASQPALLRLFDALRAGGPVEDEFPGDPVPLYLAALRQQWEDARAGRPVDSLFEDIHDVDVALGMDVSGGAKVALLTGIARRALSAERSHASLGLERAVPVHFVVVPSAVDVCRRFGITVDPAIHPGYDPEALAAAHVGALRLAGAERVHDLDPPLRALEEPGDLFVGGTDIHWNARGQRWAARLVARQIAADPLTRARLLPDPPSDR
ncbi:MAG: hypothetical protein VXZ39_14715 [Planctomycetota bacterium]|nr:hypothetical protein [Planctomycetota bacterium]